MAKNRGLCPHRENHQLGWWMLIFIWRYDVTEIFLSKERVYRIGASNKHAAIACFDAFTGDCEWNICMIP
jgi:hypothetical protein